jgi:hypothetical protein
MKRDNESGGHPTALGGYNMHISGDWFHLIGWSAEKYSEEPSGNQIHHGGNAGQRTI